MSETHFIWEEKNYYLNWICVGVEVFLDFVELSSYAIIRLFKISYSHKYSIIQIITKIYFTIKVYEKDIRKNFFNVKRFNIFYI
jgi:hypothetical protein